VLGEQTQTRRSWQGLWWELQVFELTLQASGLREAGVGLARQQQCLRYREEVVVLGQHQKGEATVGGRWSRLSMWWVAAEQLGHTGEPVVRTDTGSRDNTAASKQSSPLPGWGNWCRRQQGTGSDHPMWSPRMQLELEPFLRKARK
jgi:hypothetical protein